MEAQFRGAYREFTADSIFSEEVQAPALKTIWVSRRLLANGMSDPQNETMIRIASEGLNIVSSRNAKKNVVYSLRIALDLAAQGMRVMYVNTFANLALLRESLQAELSRLESDIEKANNGEPTANPINVSTIAEVKSNFHIMDCKMGMWESYRYHTQDKLYEEKSISYSSNEKKLTQNIDVLVMNSFEFAAITYRAKLDVAQSIMAWMAKIKLTTIVFTQECQEGMEAGMPVRGPLGLLTSAANTLVKDVPVKAEKSEDEEEESLPDTNAENIYSDDPTSEAFQAALGDKPVGSRDLPLKADSEREMKKDKRISKTAIRIYYDGGGQISGVQYPKGYNGKRYDLAFFPRTVMDDVPDGIEAVQVVGMPPMDDASVGYSSRGNWEQP